MPSLFVDAPASRAAVDVNPAARDAIQAVLDDPDAMGREFESCGRRHTLSGRGVTPCRSRSRSGILLRDVRTNTTHIAPGACGRPARKCRFRIARAIGLDMLVRSITFNEAASTVSAIAGSGANPSLVRT